jgi:outer membrane immunogenic protein
MLPWSGNVSGRHQNAGRVAKGSLEGMKKIVWLGALLLGALGVSRAQESRQDFSVSGFGIFAPDIYNGVAFPMTTTKTVGVLGSYRFLLTPRSGLEANYSFAQNSIKYRACSIAHCADRVYTRQQEATVAYVYSRNYKNFNPFLEGGGGAMFFTPILNASTTAGQGQIRQSTQIGGLFGGGVAYEISPSFDIRAEYRGYVLKAPTFGVSYLSPINAYYVISMPTIGVAYHF